LIADVEIVDGVGYEEYRRRVPAAIAAYGGATSSRRHDGEAAGQVVAGALRDHRVYQLGTIQGVVDVSRLCPASSDTTTHSPIEHGCDKRVLMADILHIGQR
jgi:hypothetical protein